jgi:hypothetical protein
MLASDRRAGEPRQRQSATKDDECYLAVNPFILGKDKGDDGIFRRRD